ncbi:MULTISPECIES: 16S rRNA (cytosine(1402)-N(4))-methyltransferase RsmH [unclassified Fusibacter]|uniref:16S rRNA (cytosine(1402)-N(4))-methyltransferase RsmH n=1 Tax=unclassified Fusibacter TaxID=2624464 RepID=UPI0010119845|nr:MULTISPECIES: 16S rRNA (cytosine(1402)-N(4))-methyltransferase RsmH [unclassified Fusibacter]MCK8061324.1 16S rRNA (cytosine(1402)-N(4))-methyltransferase RsmH [Fusibacter sp. A2]NPE23479.1 16S rRNA (cytosine(1402)-N(4))-methyltransferase RsmH [Fusibacter sp. A1]RXV59085.1 16S rRNA (cytosine(1402)-N(4))-methyltransferase RsmH [Fusibacter sp. A1]
MKFEHVSVLYQECIDGLAIKEDGIYVDGTLGGGGHSGGILEKLTTGRLIGIDQDPAALKAASDKLAEHGEKFIPYRSNFSDLNHVLDDLGIAKIDGMLMDLGVSSHQLDTPERGFSYNHDAPLDMRMDPSAKFSAFDVVNTYTAKELEGVIKDYGEENWARRIAMFIVEKRQIEPIRTTFELVEVIKAAVPKKARMDGPHPAKRTFQAIRIEVNRELDIISTTIKDAASRMNKGGRIAIITFHSLEDRIVKNMYRDLANDCVCPPKAPICTCNTVPLLKVVTRKPIAPSTEELEVNPRSRSAKLRVAERI